MTLFLSEKQTESLLDMEEVVDALREAFRREASGESINSMRTRSRTSHSVLNVMHASSYYLGRAGVKCYMSSKVGTKFVFILFDMNDSEPLAVMGADALGRFRTGAASGVATESLYPSRSAVMTVLGSGGQAFTQVSAVGTVLPLKQVRVWSPHREHREGFARRLEQAGFNAACFDSPKAALDEADIATTITSSSAPFLDAEDLGNVSHINVCGGNDPGRSELTPSAVGTFDTVVVDDLPQAKAEYGDLIQAERAGKFSWRDAVELKSVVSGRTKPEGKTLFKSGGAALEDVAVGSLIYNKAMKSEKAARLEFQLS